MALELHAPGKVNLYLDVLGKRPDGYHDLKSLVAPVSVFDTLAFEPRRDGIEVAMEAEIYFEGIPWPMPMCGPQDNLVTRAARLLQETTGHAGGAAIRLTKRIPVAAGLGGGSSDAAATLQGLNALWSTGLPPGQLLALGARLGSDIPALLQDGPTCMEGRGERITPLPRLAHASLWMILVYPGFGVSTSDIYARHDSSLTTTPPADTFSSLLAGIEQRQVKTVAGCLYNALQATVFRKYPLLAIIRDELERAGAARALLSGSGSTVFALVDTPDHGREVESRFRARVGFPVWTRVVGTVSEGAPAGRGES